MGLIIVAALIVYVGGMNIINFMDGINGITAGYALAISSACSCSVSLTSARKGKRSALQGMWGA